MVNKEVCKKWPKMVLKRTKKVSKMDINCLKLVQMVQIIKRMTMDQNGLNCQNIDINGQK